MKKQSKLNEAQLFLKRLLVRDLLLDGIEFDLWMTIFVLENLVVRVIIPFRLEKMR